MSGDHWERVQTLFAALQERPPAERAAYLDQATEDPTLRAEVRSLLAAAEGAGRFDDLATYVGSVGGARTAPDPLPRLQAALADRYRIERVLGQGGMAIVYLAEDLKHHRPVALKLLRPELAAHLGPQRFLREIDTSARLTHPHILPLHDSGETEGLFYYVMPYVEGESLRDRLSRESQIPLAEAVTITREVADALSYAHSLGIVHRDIKPENILCSAGHALVSDFGIAHALDAAGGDRITGTGMAIGTPAYMSPEQARAGVVVDGRSDLYSLGCVVYEMLGGLPPFTGPTPQAVLARHALDPVPSLRTLRPSVPPGVQDAIERALAKVPADRFATVREFSEALERALHAPPAATPPSDPPAWRRRIGLGVLLTLMLVGGWWLGRTLLSAGTGRLASLVVLPVSNLSSDPEQDYFAAGVHDALIGELARIGALRVISRTSARRYADTRKTVSEIARELHVEWVVEAAAGRDGDSVRVQVRLIQALPEERQRWGDTYRRPVTSVLSMYGDVARAIARAAHVRLTPEEDAQLAGTRQVNPRTYEAYLRGMFYLGQQTPDGITKGLASLRAAVENDPADPLAYAGLALGYDVIGHGPAPPPDAFVRARAAAVRAVQLDSTLAEGHAALAQIKLYAKPEWDWDGAGRAFERALALNPSLGETRVHYGWYFMLIGRPDDAVAQMRRARETDPLSPLIAAWLAHLYWAYGRYGEALVQARAALDLSPEFPVGLYELGLVYASMGRYEEAIAAHRRAGAASPAWRWALAHTYALAGRTAEARRLLADLEREPDVWNTWGIAEIYTALGDKDAAFRWLQAAYDQGHSYIPWLQWNPNFAPLRDDPRFEALRRRLRLPA